MNDLTLKIKKRLLGDSYFKEERYISDSNKPIYYIIRRVPFGEGFFSNYFYVLSHVVYACEKGWKPVVDMEHYKTLYHDSVSEGNLWERYFEPMGGVSLKQAYVSKNYVLSSGKYMAESGVPVYEINQGHITNEMVENLQKYIRKYMCVSAEIANEVERFKADNNWRGDRLIGVHVRGTDMRAVREGHTVSPKTDKLIRQVDSRIKADDNNRIFLCTDEQEVVGLFREKYRDKVFFCDEYRSTVNDGIGIHKENRKQTRASHKYLLGREILIDVILLSQCNTLICGISNVTSAAILMNNKCYSDVYVLR